MYARGLSTRDIEDALKEATGGDMVPRRSSVSRITEELWEDYETFAQRDLSKLDVVYLFLDAIYESLREQADLKEGILVSRGILSDGSKVLIHVTLGNKESYEDWLEHLEAVRDASDYEAGRRLADELTGRFESAYPSAMRAFKEDLEASLAHLKPPYVHRRHVRTTNLIERSFEEERRRAKVIPRFRAEKECLKLVFATLWRSSERWRRVRSSEHERRQLERYRQERAARKAAQRDGKTAIVA